jgi:hypothetical protein
LEETSEDVNTGLSIDHVERGASSCFVAATYVQRIQRSSVHGE